jgi:hypothetical protein
VLTGLLTPRCRVRVVGGVMQCSRPGAKMSAAAASAERITWAYTRRVTAGSAWPRRAATTMHRDAGEQQGRGVEMPEIVEACSR